MLTDLPENTQERDLVLAAHIGKTLLEENDVLKGRINDLERELASSNDTVTQLKHDISTKNRLIQIYSADLENESETDTSDCTFSSDRGSSSSSPLNWKIIQDQINFLTNENLKLRSEASKRALDIEAEEKRELILIHDCAKQLIEANKQLINLQEELARRTEDNVNQQKEVTNLLSQVVDLQKKIRNISLENEGLHSALDLAHECQNVLSSELLDMKKKYSVLLTAFQELQDEMKRKSELNLTTWPPSGSFMPFAESLAAELESSLESDGYESGLSSLNQRTHRPDTGSISPDSVLCMPSGHTPRISPKSSGPTNLFQSRQYFSEKLKIVKPLEGSEFLNKWKKMATPHLEAIFENPPGVHTKILKDIRTDLHELAHNRKAIAQRAEIDKI